MKSSRPPADTFPLGKLTARLEKRSEVGDQRSDSANQKSTDLCPLTADLFAIRTPTAIVTDLGTEFGVEVDNQGFTTSHVFPRLGPDPNGSRRRWNGAERPHSTCPRVGASHARRWR